MTEIIRLEEELETKQNELIEFSDLVRKLEAKNDFKSMKLNVQDIKVRDLTEEIHLMMQEQQQFELRMEQVL